MERYRQHSLSGIKRYKFVLFGGLRRLLTPSPAFDIVQSTGRPGGSEAGMARTNHPSTPGDHLMTTKRAVLIGCGGAFFVFVVAIAFSVNCYQNFIQDPEGVAISVEGPLTVTLGEEFTLTVVVRNLREEEPFHLSEIDIAESYLDHFLILGTKPRAKSEMHVPLDNTRSFSYEVPVAPLQEKRFAFQFRSTAPGLFRGDVDVCEGTRFLTTSLQTEVLAGP
jgi:hypothetical protein